MASLRDPSASAGLPAADTSSDDNATLIENLSFELVMQETVLASLRDVPETSETEREIATVKAKITQVKRQLAEARAKEQSSGTGVDTRNSVDQFGGDVADDDTSTSSSNSMDSSFGFGYSRDSGLRSRKRSIGSSHLGIDLSGGEIARSRRPSPAPRNFRSSFGGFGDGDFEEVIDLTGEDDNVWRSAIQRQKEAEQRAQRTKADAALARQLDERPSPPSNGSFIASSSQLGQHNAFDRILGRSLHSRTQGRAGYIKQEPGPAPVTRHDASVKTEPGLTPGQNGLTHSSGPFTVKREPVQHHSQMPGSYVDSDDEDEHFVIGSSRNPFGHPSRPSLPSRANPFASYDLTTTAPTLPSMSRNPALPGIELARQSSMARQGGSSAWAPSGPIAQQLRADGRVPDYSTPDWYSSHHSILGATRPGFVNNGGYYSQPGLSGSSSSLAETIARVSRFDFHNMIDGEGNPFSDRLTTYLDDFVHDPRKTEEDIKQLLSNIRPDMEIPEEERGETPEAMKYPLYVHQQLALKWMTEMEQGTNKGGILADDMGLGKTISTLALMVSRPASDNVKTNLIIGPVSLIKQWEQEVKKKLKGTHKLSVLLLHSKKKPYSEIKRYDVVLTTFGSLAAEWKRYNQHVEQRRDSDGYEEEGDMELARKCPLLHPRSKFYRVILDEAQCIKNKDTQSSQAVDKIISTYRWCLTGTPMMNGVSELFPLIRFLKIRPYCVFRTFQDAFRGLNPKSQTSDYHRDNAMRKLQAVLKAIMLRRMKDSMIDGKPILTLPPKTENSEHVVFSDDERKFYQDLESRSQVIFNRFLRAGTVGKNYSNILVLLLRLRQACCHPHLVDFDIAAAQPSSADMVDLAKELDDAVVERIKAIEAFECPICYDGVEDPLLIIPCGHDICTECFASVTENIAQANIRSGNENGVAKCPVCRGPIGPSSAISLTAFRKVHAPETLPPDAVANGEPDDMTVSDDDSSDDSDSEVDDTEPDADRFGNLAGFVVPDDDVEDDVDAEIDVTAQRLKQQQAEQAKEVKDAKMARKLAKKEKKRSKAKGKAKAKPKSEEVKPHMLNQLRTEADKNKDARRRYMHFLRDNWEDSAKVTQVIELLQQIQETDEKTIIFSQWTSLLDMIECQIKYKLNLRYCRYTGKMSRNQRDEAVQDFNENPRNRVMLVSLRAGNAGLNLTMASRVIICDPFWNPFIEAQAVDRAHRIGQQREVQVHRILVKETVEDRILTLQENKRRLVEAALDEGQSKNLGRLSERELAYLFGVNPSSS